MIIQCCSRLFYLCYYSLTSSYPITRYVCVLSGVQLFETLWTVACRFFCSWAFPGRNTGVGCHFLLQRIFSTQGQNPRLRHILHQQVGSLPLNHLGSPITWHSSSFISFPPQSTTSPLSPLLTNTIAIHPAAQARKKSQPSFFLSLCIPPPHLPFSRSDSHLLDSETSLIDVPASSLHYSPTSINLPSCCQSHLSKTQVRLCFVFLNTPQQLPVNFRLEPKLPVCYARLFMLIPLLLLNNSCHSHSTD